MYETQPTDVPAPEPEARLRLSVSPLSGPAGTTLNFSASLSGGKNRRSIALWVMKDGERVAVFPSNKSSSWSYVAESPGIYKGMAIHKDDNGTLYASSKEVTIGEEDAIAEQGGMMWMDLDPPLIWIEPFGSVLTYVEGTSFEPIPVTVGGSERIQDARLYISTTNLLQYSAVKKQSSPLTPEGEVWGYIRSDDFPNAPAIDESFIWNEKDQMVPQGDDPRKTGIFGDKLELRISANVYVIGSLRGRKMEANYPFTILYLRDSDRDGIPDISEAERDKINITDIPDRSVYSDYPIRRFSYTVIDDGKAQWPVKYRSPGVQPYGLEVLPKGWTDSGDPYTHGCGVFIGEPRINWLPGEMYRDLRIRYRAQDSKKDSVTHYFRMRVSKNGSPWSGFAKLSIDPVPSCTVVYGQRMKPIPITVRASEPGIPTVEGSYMWLEEEGRDLVFKSHTLGDHGMGVSKVIESGVDQQNLYLTHTYWISGTPKLQKPAKWRKGETRREIRFSIIATLGSEKAYEHFSITVLRPDRETGDELEPLQFEALNDVAVDEGVACRDIVCRLRSRQPLSGVEFSSSALPPGMGIGKDNGSSTAMVLRGRPYLEDWQPWETQRKILIYVFAKQKEKGLSSQESFYLTIRRKDLPTPGITPITTQEAMDGLFASPVHVSCDLPPFMLNSLEAQGLPPGLSLGRGHVISGFINVKDWKEGEQLRVYPVTIKGRASLPRRPELDEEGTGNPRQYDVETGFDFKVYQNAPWGWSQGDPLPPVKVLHPQNQRVVAGNAIKPVSILIGEKDGLTSVLVDGLPPGVSDDGKGNISGSPQPGGWSDDTSEVKRFNVKVTVSHPDLENDIVVTFAIDVLHPNSAKPASLPGKAGTEAQPPDATATPAPPSEAADKPGGSAQGKPDKGSGEAAATEKPEEKADAGETEKSMTREESITSQNRLRELSPGTPEYEELEAWIARQEEELKSRGPIAVREGRVRAAIALYEGSQAETDYAQGILTGLEKAGYQLGRRHLSADIQSAQGDETKAQRLAQTISRGKYDLVIAVGTPMADRLKKALAGKVPLICGMVEDEVNEGLAGPNDSLVTGVRLRPSLESLLNAALYLQPEAERIGLIHSPFDRRQQEAQEVSAVSGVEIRLASASGIAKLLLQAEQLLEDCDLLIVTEDFENDEMLRQLAAMGLEKGKLVIGGSKAQVTAGLPAACATDAKKIGELGGWLGALALSSQNPAGIPWQSPDALDILYDPEGLSALGITPPAAAIPLMGRGGK